MNSKAKFYDAKGNLHEVELSATLYHEAHDSGMTVGQYLEAKFGDKTDPKYGTIIEQMAATSGLIIRPNDKYGLKSPTLAEVFNGRAIVDANAVVGMNASVITRDSVPASRILFPAVFLQWIENNLVPDFETTAAVLEEMIAISETVAGARFEQPKVDFSKPQGARSQGIAQASLPSSMMTITASDDARKIPTFSLGLEISNEALKATTLDFLALSLQRQVAAERDARAEGYIKAMVEGDLDNGDAALVPVGLTTYDGAATAGTLTQKGWVKFLLHNFKKRHISHVMCDVDTALKIENRQGKPVITSDDPNSPRIDATFTLLAKKLQNVKLLPVEDGVIATNKVVGIDSRYAIRRVRNSEAQYQAAEQFVMRKSEQLRFDFGEFVHRLYDEAWDVLDINA